MLYLDSKMLYSSTHHHTRTMPPRSPPHPSSSSHLTDFQTLLPPRALNGADSPDPHQARLRRTGYCSRKSCSCLTCGGTEIDKGADVDKLARAHTAAAPQTEDWDGHSCPAPGGPLTQRPVRFDEERRRSGGLWSCSATVGLQDCLVHQGLGFSKSRSRRHRSKAASLQPGKRHRSPRAVQEQPVSLADRVREAGRGSPSRSGIVQIPWQARITGAGSAETASTPSTAIHFLILCSHWLPQAACCHPQSVGTCNISETKAATSSEILRILVS